MSCDGFDGCRGSVLKGAIANYFFQGETSYLHMSESVKNTSAYEWDMEKSFLKNLLQEKFTLCIRFGFLMSLYIF